MSAPDLLAVIESLACDFGIERSVKLTSAGINLDRYLLSVHKDDLGAHSAAAFEGLLETLGVPTRRRRDLLEHFARAEIVHFGHEGGTPPVRKVYLEFAANQQPAPSDGRRQIATVHRALKWRIGDHDGRFSRYDYDTHLQSAAALASALDTTGVGLARPLARSAFDQILDTARVLASGQTLMVLEVSEETSARRSWDINLYPAGMRGDLIASATRTMFMAYDLPDETVEDLQIRLAVQSVGHIAIGIDDDGRDFATLYFGVESRHGHD